MNDHTTILNLDYERKDYGADVTGAFQYIIPFLLNAATEDAKERTTKRDWYVVRAAHTIEEARITDAWIGSAEYVLSMIWPALRTTIDTRDYAY